jgi:hypothetical protein
MLTTMFTRLLASCNAVWQVASTIATASRNRSLLSDCRATHGASTPPGRRRQPQPLPLRLRLLQHRSRPRKRRRRRMRTSFTTNQAWTSRGRRRQQAQVRSTQNPVKNRIAAGSSVDTHLQIVSAHGTEHLPASLSSCRSVWRPSEMLTDNDHTCFVWMDVFDLWRNTHRRSAKSGAQFWRCGFRGRAACAGPISLPASAQPPPGRPCGAFPCLPACLSGCGLSASHTGVARRARIDVTFCLVEFSVRLSAINTRCCCC